MKIGKMEKNQSDAHKKKRRGEAGGGNRRGKRHYRQEIFRKIKILKNLPETLNPI
jgi:hypothetical protein